MYVLVVGNLNTGFEFVGPFDTFDDAADFDSRNLGGGNWVASLTTPDDSRAFAARLTGKENVKAKADDETEAKLDNVTFD